MLEHYGTQQKKHFKSDTHKKFETRVLVHKKVLLMESEAYCIKVSS